LSGSAKIFFDLPLFAVNSLNFADYFEMENGPASVFKIDINEGT